MNIQPIIDNLTNGNLTDAKNQAKKVSFKNLISLLSEEVTKQEAIYMASYLKGQINFAQYCKAMHKH